MKLYIANLGKYNEGILMGDWIQLPFSEDELNELFVNIGLGEYDEDGDYTHGVIERDEQGNEYHYEEWAIHDTDDVPFTVGEYDNLQRVNELAEQYDSVTEDVREIVEAICKYDSYYTPSEVIDMYNDGELRVYYECKDMSDVAYEIVNECYTLEGPLANYFDYESFGRDLDIEGTYIQINYNTIVEVCR